MQSVQNIFQVTLKGSLFCLATDVVMMKIFIVNPSMTMITMLADFQ